MKEEIVRFGNINKAAGITPGLGPRLASKIEIRKVQNQTHRRTQPQCAQGNARRAEDQPQALWHTLRARRRAPASQPERRRQATGSGVPDELKELKICLAFGSGYIPCQIGRINYGGTVREDTVSAFQYAEHIVKVICPHWKAGIVLKRYARLPQHRGVKDIAITGHYDLVRG